MYTSTFLVAALLPLAVFAQEPSPAEGEAAMATSAPGGVESADAAAPTDGAATTTTPLADGAAAGDSAVASGSASGSASASSPAVSGASTSLPAASGTSTGASSKVSASASGAAGSITPPLTGNNASSISNGTIPGSNVTGGNKSDSGSGAGALVVPASLGWAAGSAALAFLGFGGGVAILL